MTSPLGASIAGPALLDLIPHRPPMVLIDAILDSGPEHVRARMEVSPDKFFLQPDGSFPAWAGIELMAQTIAAYGGLQAKAAGRPVQVGFLLGTRRYECDCASFPAGSELIVTVQRLLIDEQGLGAFECRIDSAAGSASANLNIFQPVDPAAFLASQPSLA